MRDPVRADDGREPSLGSADEHDTPAEVDAAFRTLRRVAIGHVAVFTCVIIAVPLLTAALDWWSQGRLSGGMSPMFAMTAFGLYAFFFVVCLAAATLSNAVEERMLGGPAREAHHDQEGKLPP
ncbi:hypothetical protein ACFQZ2_06565 [Streptomonospora algeriensis]|uniref:Uncharacterized protein n=1 Tax=Streptomonospora algeriensis TaxID=995084 RepID=A0ABW3BFQ6_9ACTN